MDLSSRKYKLIEKILKVEEEGMIYQLESILDDDSKDLWTRLPLEVKHLLEQSIAQSEDGKTKLHEDIMPAIKKKYSSN